MMPYRDGKILNCYTAKKRLKETREWLDDMMKPEIFNNTESFDRHILAFCNSFASAIDFVHSDFVFHKIKQQNQHKNLVSIDWRKFTRSRQDREEIIENHPEKNAIKKFRSEYKNKKDILLKDPLVNYFYNKRQEYTHIQWSGSKFGTFSGEGTNEQHNYRALEVPYWFEIHEKYPDTLLPMFDDYIPIDKQLEVLRMLTDDELNIRDIGNKLCDKVQEFIDCFEGKDYFS